jgi:tetratricopeptide (TPR) repeat protein/tRNA A-37 threonylcarbamoyl transferase component Bud32
MNELDLFAAAISITDPAKLEELLDQECAGQPELRKRIDQLLDAHFKANPVLDQPGQDPAEIHAAAGNGAAFTNEPPPAPVGAEGSIVAGRYKLLQQIGEGGMGSVWMADQTEPVKRRVAVKLIRADRGQSRTILARFEAERQAIALMDHPHIARLLDAGTTEVGAPYFVMELVRGTPLTEFCDAHRLSIPDRLKLLLQICGAVQHAHQKGIIHRDLKPSNILVESHDGKPVPRVIDFGLAKATTGLQLSEHTLFTAFGSVLGTPRYMAPEQATFNAVDVDTRADIYALGVILYELLTGTTPISRESIRQAAVDEVLKLIREQEAPTPSSRLRTSESMPSVAANRQTEPARLGRLVRGELDWIALRALAKERDRRYATASGFARDLERFLNHEPVQAGPPAAAYRLRKFVRRNRGQVIAAGLVLAALLAGIAGTSLGLIRAERALAREAAQRKVAEDKEREAQAEKQKAIEFRDKALGALRAATGPDVEKLIGGNKELGANEKAYLEAIAARWLEFARQEGTDEQSRAIQAEGHHRVGWLWNRLGRTEEAMKEDEQALAIREKLAADFPKVPDYRRDLSRSHNNLGIALKPLGRHAEAEDHWRKALDIQEKLAAEFPTVPDYFVRLAMSHHNLGTLLPEVGRGSEAEKEFDQAIAIHEKLAADFPEVTDHRARLAESHHNLGFLLAEVGRWSEARRHYDQALAIQEKLAAELPEVTQYRNGVAVSHSNLGRLLAAQEKPHEAEEQYRRALALLERLAAEFPAVPDYRLDEASSRNDLGKLLRGLGRQAEAEKELRQARPILEELVADFPNVPDYRRSLAFSHNSRGELLADLGYRTQAEKEVGKSVALLEKLATDFPAVPDYRIRLGGSYGNLGNLIMTADHPADSLEWFQKAIDTLRPVHEQEPRNVKARQFLRDSHKWRAMAYGSLQRWAEAEKDWNRAIDLSPADQQPGVRASRAVSLAKADRLAEAIAGVAELTRSGTGNAAQWFDFACVYSVASGKIADKKGEYADRAMELLQKAVQAGWTNAAHIEQDHDLDALRDRAEFKKLIADLEKQAQKK